MVDCARARLPASLHLVCTRLDAARIRYSLHLEHWHLTYCGLLYCYCL